MFFIPNMRLFYLVGFILVYHFPFPAQAVKFIRCQNRSNIFSFRDLRSCFRNLKFVTNLEEPSKKCDPPLWKASSFSAFDFIWMNIIFHCWRNIPESHILLHSFLSPILIQLQRAERNHYLMNSTWTHNGARGVGNMWLTSINHSQGWCHYGA